MSDAPDHSADGWGRAAHRLRDLDRRERGYAALLFAFMLVPFAVAIARALHDGWIPSGDEANVATRALDVLSRHPPLTGLPTTTAQYGGKIATNHPGPIEFYLLALPLRVLGSTAGPLLTAAAINAAFVLIALWVVFRRLGTTAMLWAGALMAAVIWSAGTAVLVDTLSSNMTLYSLLCTAVLAWALVDGDLRLLPLAVIAASYAAQQHLAAGIIVAALGVAAAAAVLVQRLPRRQRGAPFDITRRRVLVAAGIALVVWSPVVIDEVRSHPGNLTQIVKFARDNSRATLGFHSAIDQTVRTIAPPTILARTDTSGGFFLGGLDHEQVFLGVVVIAALAAVAWFVRRHRPAVARLAFVGLVLLAAGFLNGANVPRSVEANRANLYRWAWGGAFVGWVTLGLAAAFVVAKWVRSPISRRASALVAPIALLLVTAIVTVATGFVSGADDHSRERPAFALEKRASAAVLARVDRHRPVVVITDGYAAALSVAPAVIYQLVHAGVAVEVPAPLAQAYGNHRAYRARSGTAAIFITSAPTTPRPHAGAVIFDSPFSAARAAVLHELAVEAQGQPAKLAPGARAAIRRQYGAQLAAIIATVVARFPKRPRAVLEQPLVLDLLLQGRIVEPHLDLARVRRLAALPADDTTIGGDEVVQIRYVSAQQLPTTDISGR